MTFPFNWWIILTVFGGGLSVLGIVNWIRGYFSPEAQFDALSGWSLSVRPGNPAIAVRNGDVDRYLLQMSQIYNLSAVQAREIELELFLPYYDSDRPPVRLTATRVGDWPCEDIWKDRNPRYSDNLAFPIAIDANDKREGRIEFEVPAGIKAADTDWSSPAVKVVEKRAGRSITIVPDHVYDARNGRQYRGELHSPFPKEVQRNTND